MIFNFRIVCHFRRKLWAFQSTILAQLFRTAKLEMQTNSSHRNRFLWVDDFHIKLSKKPYNSPLHFHSNGQK